MNAMIGVSFVVPVHNGARWIRETLESIFAQADGRPMEVIVVDDESRDGSLALVQQLADRAAVRVISSDGRGAAAAINTGIRAARFPIICQIDQDVVLKSGWMERILVRVRRSERRCGSGILRDRSRRRRFTHA